MGCPVGRRRVLSGRLRRVGVLRMGLLRLMMSGRAWYDRGEIVRFTILLMFS